MRIFRHYAELPADIRGGVVALGNFDGVHMGHQAVIREAMRLADEAGAAHGVMSFEPHPRMVFNPVLPPFRLTPFRTKARHVEALGVNFLIMQHFDRDFAAHTAEEFVDQVLVGGLAVRHVVVGYDYVFGHGRKGNCEVLKAMGASRGFGVTCLPPVLALGGDVYSSTRVRQYLTDSKPREAAKLLGSYWEIEGRVEHGDARGRTIGFPTANLHLGEYLHPATGVYAVRAGIDRGGATVWHDGVANFGRRPTFDKTDVLLEVHLLDFEGDLYGRHLRVALIEHIRPESKFDGIDALRAQIAQDAAAAKAILGRHHFSGGAGLIVPAD